MKTGYTKEQVQKAIESSKSVAEICRKLDCVGYTLNRVCKQYGLEYKTNQSGRGISKRRKYKSPEDVFRKEAVSSESLVFYLKQEREWKCECCGLTEWQGKRLPLEVHHIDGDHSNNCRENLQILCPNCHSITENWRSRNTKGYSSTQPKVSDERLLQTIQSSKSINQALKSLGLAGGSNYYRAYRLLEKAPMS